MKIRRIKRGYTTNSSSANEWLPPPIEIPSVEGVTPSVGAEPALPPPVRPPAKGRSSSGDAGAPSVARTRPPAKERSGSEGTTAGVRGNDDALSVQARNAEGTASQNLQTMGILLGIVCFLFLVAAVLKRLFGGGRRRQ